jgi:uncharacterized repeat protein (TIGR01451 family)
VNKRLAAIVGIATFLVLAGTGAGFALWSSNATITGTVKAATLADNCTSSSKLTNGGLENPNISPATLTNLATTGLPGWSVLNDTTIEVWRNHNDTAMPVHPLPAAEGSQLVELNGNGPGTLYQDIATVPGQRVHWSVKHHGRWGTDTMKVSINAPGAALVQQSQFSTPNTEWRTYEGTYTVPAGQTTSRISLTAVSTATANNSVGNLIDDISFGVGPCLTSTSTITNVTTGNSTFRVGDVVEYVTTLTNSGGNHATSSVFTASVPAGLTYSPGTIAIDGVTKSDSAGNDQAEISGATITARLGQDASASAGGDIPPANTVTVRFRATIQAAAAEGNLTFTSSTGYVDALVPTWPLTAVSPTLTTPVAGSADIAVAAQTIPVIGPGSGGQNRTWTFLVTNNGPSTATGVSVVVNVPSNMVTPKTVTIAGGGTCSTVVSNASTCTVGSMTPGSTRTITYTGRMDASPANQYDVTATATSTSSDAVPGNNSATGTAAYDGQAPSQPLNFTATRASATQVNLTWQTSNDNVAVVGYRIYRNGTLVTTTSGTGTTFQDTGLTSNLPYWYWVQAIDAAGNVSPASTGDGAVTFSTTSKYIVKFLGNTNTTTCLMPDDTNENSVIKVRPCTTTPVERRQWSFFTASGGAVDDNVYIEFASASTKRWRVDNNNNSELVRTSADADTNAFAQWNLGASWDGTNAYVEIRRSSSLGKCIDVQNGNTTAGTQVQQYDCHNGYQQRFVLGTE